MMAPPARTAGAALTLLSVIGVLSCIFLYTTNKSRSKSSTRKDTLKKPKSGLVAAIGNTPLIRINSLSDATGCEILGKAEFLNPGGSVKDRVAVKIIEEALECGALAPGGVVTEGSAGSTAISLATVAPAYGCRCHVVIPDDAAIEKSQILEALGANVERVRPVSITHRDHFVNIARRRALEANELASKRQEEGSRVSSHLNQNISHDPDDLTHSSECLADCKGGFFADQFENLANCRAHYEGTGPEIWEHVGGKADAFVAAAGTGGTVAGVSRFLKEKKPSIKCFLIDPPGSGLFNKVTRGVMYTKEEAEGKRLKNPFDTITEGIGINRLTENFKMAQLDGAFRGSDKEAVEMSRYLMKKDGLFLGSSSAMNCVGAVKVAQKLGPGHTIVTILCDSGMRHLSKFYNPQYLAQNGLTPSAVGLEFLGYNTDVKTVNGIHTTS
ncbi:Pyridoxal-5-phosphate-dependent enzyme family protein [Striga hermonthica]|uniref:cysteine synthase n=1 Tax=Striga hermonthica TaxID=68872 RepID=A0A9N7MXH5_STRHE|nr:Pyridoxal-5-phosphate-dependent enzyme family protein [Striga hermonthica]